MAVVLADQRSRRAVRNLSFCYLCGTTFTPDEKTDHDHVPPEAAFRKVDREPLKLRTHQKCNASQSANDEKFAQLLGLRRREYVDSRNRRLKIEVLRTADRAGITNLDVDDAIWRWVRGFHTALYREFLPADSDRAIVSPFPRADKDTTGKFQLAALRPQHEKFVEWIKISRAKRNLDRIQCNSGQVRYECVWVPSDNLPDTWLCVFALNVCDWADLGRIAGIPSRGCAGAYMMWSRNVPSIASRFAPSSLTIPNLNTLDPFAP